MTRKSYSKEFKQAIIDAIREGRTQTEIGEQLGIPQATLSRWYNNVKKKQKRYPKPLFKRERKNYSEMTFEELFDCLTSDDNKVFADYLYQQYKDKGIALRYCLVILDPPKDSRGGTKNYVKH